MAMASCVSNRPRHICTPHSARASAMPNLLKADCDVRCSMQSPRTNSLGSLQIRSAVLNIRGCLTCAVPSKAKPATIPKAVLRVPEGKAGHPDLNSVKTISTGWDAAQLDLTGSGWTEEACLFVEKGIRLIGHGMIPPERIYNLDSCKFLPFQHAKQSISATLTANALGGQLPTGVVVTQPDASSAQLEAAIGSSPNIAYLGERGTNGTMMCEYLESVLVKQTGCSKHNPVLLIVDYHTNRLVGFKDCCQKNGIVVHCLPRRSTKFCQPLDAAPVLPALKKSVVKSKQQARLEGSEENQISTLFEWSMVEPAIHNVHSGHVAKLGFEMTGLFPFHPLRLMTNLVRAAPESEDLEVLRGALMALFQDYALRTQL